MSEYQYYEFRAVDRPLTTQERAQLRALSTRAEITSTSLTNSYQWGDFRGEPADLIDRHFDAFVYFANWGSRQLMIRVPRRFLAVENVQPYCDEESLRARRSRDNVVIEFSSEDESGSDDDEYEDAYWMASLIGLRDELIRGDYRALYLGWLASFRQLGWEDEEDIPEDEDGGNALEPPVPPGLAELSAPLRTLAEFLRIEDELIQVAAEASAPEPPPETTGADLARWVQQLPVAKKDAILVRFLTRPGSKLLRAELEQQFREATITPTGNHPVPNGQRTIRQLLAARTALVRAKEEKAAQRAARERASTERKQAEARAKYLDGLIGREIATWREVETLIATKLPKNYDRAVALIKDLHDLAQRSGQTTEVLIRIQQVRQQHGKKPSLIDRFDRQGLGKAT